MGEDWCFLALAAVGDMELTWRRFRSASPVLPMETLEPNQTKPGFDSHNHQKHFVKLFQTEKRYTNLLSNQVPKPKKATSQSLKPPNSKSPNRRVSISRVLREKISQTLNRSSLSHSKSKRLKIFWEDRSNLSWSRSLSLSLSVSLARVEENTLVIIICFFFFGFYFIYSLRMEFGEG